MYSFTVNYEWEQLSDRMPVWGLNPEDEDYTIELAIERHDNGDAYSILHRKNPDDMEYETVADITTFDGSVHEVKELVWFLAHNISDIELDEDYEWEDFLHINPDAPGDALLDIIDFLELKYDYNHSRLTTTQRQQQARQAVEFGSRCVCRKYLFRLR